MKSAVLFNLFLLFSLAGCASTRIDPNEEMAKVVNAESKTFLGCYRKHGARKEFDTVIKYRLNYGGEIQFAEIDSKASPSTSPDMAACVLNHFKTIRLPAVEGYDGAWGTYAFRFSSK